MLLVKLAVESHVDAFAIRRVVESTFQPSLLDSESNFNQRDESFKVIDISNVNRQNNFTSPETNNTKQKIIVANIEEEHNKATEKIEPKKNITETQEAKATEKILNATTNDIKNTILSSNDTLNATLSSTTAAVEGIERNDKEMSTLTESETTSTEGTTNFSTTLGKDSISIISSRIEDNSISTIRSTLKDVVSTSESLNSSEPSVTATSTEENSTKSGENYTLVNDTLNYTSISILDEESITQQNHETIKTEVDNDSYSTTTVITEIPTTTEPAILSKEVEAYTYKESNTASSPKSVSENFVQTSELELNTVQKTTTDQNSAERENTPIIEDYSTESLIPYWKKYTEIDRKRFNSTEQAENSTNSSETLVHAESGQTSPTIFPSLEKVFSMSNIPSLDQLTKELLSFTSELPTGTDAVITLLPVETTQVADATAASQTTSVLPRLDVVSSLRAGYLDYSSRFTKEPETTAFEEKDPTTVTESGVSNMSREMSTSVSFTEFLSKEPSLAAVTTPESTTSLLELSSAISNQEPTSESVSQMNITQGVIGLASQSQLVRYFLTIFGNGYLLQALWNFIIFIQIFEQTFHISFIIYCRPRTRSTKS